MIISYVVGILRSIDTDKKTVNIDASHDNPGGKGLVECKYNNSIDVDKLSGYFDKELLFILNDNIVAGLRDRLPKS